MSDIVFTPIILTLVVLNFIPSLVAYGRKHNSALAIFMLNLFLGWTGFGWIVALIWACTGDVRRPVQE